MVTRFIRRWTYALVLVCSLPVAAAETKVPIDLTGPANQQHSIQTGTVFLELYPLKPGAKYKVGSLPLIEADPAVTVTETDPKLCASPSQAIWKRLSTASGESAVAAATQEALHNASSCATEAERVAVIATVEDIRKKLTRMVALPGRTEPPLTVTISREESEESWTIYLVQGLTRREDLLDEIEKRMDADDRKTVVECSWAHDRCETDPLFVNADHISAIVFRGLPVGKKLRIVADPMAEPYLGCEILRQNSISWEDPNDTPDAAVVTLHMFRVPIWKGFSRHDRRVAALRLYGWLPYLKDPGDEVVRELCEHPFVSGATSYLDRTKQTLRSGAGLITANSGWTTNMSLKKPADVGRVILQRAGLQIEELAALPIMADGTTEQVKVTIYVDGEAPRTYIIPFFYQRWWVDAGGAFLFTQVSQDRLKTEPASAAPTETKVKVTDIKSESETKPQTGIVLNLHPGNYPDFAIQFGLSTSGENSELSYYLGPAIRLREIGKRGLATFSFGAVLTPTTSYPDVVVFDKDKPTVGIYDPTDTLLQGERDYNVGMYFGISLGFNFGGVASGADAVKEMP